MFNNYYDEFTDAKYALDGVQWFEPYNRNLIPFFEDKPKYKLLMKNKTKFFTLL